MIRQLRLVLVACVFGLITACGNPMAPDIPNPDETGEPTDPSQDVIAR